MFRSFISGAEVRYAENDFSDRNVTACISGHRKVQSADFPADERMVRLMIKHYIDCAVKDGYRVFISGLAEGTDLWAASYIADISAADRNIKLIGAMPFLHHADRFSAENKALLRKAELAAFRLYTTGDTENNICSGKELKKHEVYRIRNYFMVDNSSMLIGFYDADSRSRSGTGQTVRYAGKKGLKLHLFSGSDAAGLGMMSGGSISGAEEILSCEKYFRYL